jgi:hypothetical protein
MSVELPIFNKRSLAMTVCGQIKEGTVLPSTTILEKERVASYKTPRGKAYVRAFLKRNKKITYLHVDCALHDYFPKGKVPKALHKKDDVLKTIESLIGSEIIVNIEGGFDASMSDLPENGSIRVLSSEQKSGELSLRLIRGEISIKGSAVNSIDWNIRKDDQKEIVRVFISGEQSFKISDKYLIECLDWLDTQFAVFVLGKKNAEA